MRQVWWSGGRRTVDLGLGGQRRVVGECLRGVVICSVDVSVFLCDLLVIAMEIRVWRALHW
jgi:hypothetical protein